MYSTLTDEMDVFVLDTGRLHQETYDVLDKTEPNMHSTIAVFFPNQEHVESMVRIMGRIIFIKC